MRPRALIMGAPMAWENMQIYSRIIREQIALQELQGKRVAPERIERKRRLLAKLWTVAKKPA